MLFVNLIDRPELLPALAAAHVRAFGSLLPEWTEAQAEAELRAQQRDSIPCSWLAEDESGWLGSVSLLHDDHEQIRGWSPWLASLYVDEAARGKGVGATLVAAEVVAVAGAEVVNTITAPNAVPSVLETMAQK